MYVAIFIQPCSKGRYVLPRRDDENLPFFSCWFVEHLMCLVFLHRCSVVTAVGDVLFLWRTQFNVIIRVSFSRVDLLSAC